VQTSGDTPAEPRASGILGEPNLCRACEQSCSGMGEFQMGWLALKLPALKLVVLKPGAVHSPAGAAIQSVPQQGAEPIRKPVCAGSIAVQLKCRPVGSKGFSDKLLRTDWRSPGQIQHSAMSQLAAQRGHEPGIPR
jgi:hypothetical protein